MERPNKRAKLDTATTPENLPDVASTDSGIPLVETNVDNPTPVTPSLQTIPSEMRLQIFRYLLPETLPSTLPAIRPPTDDRHSENPGTITREVCSTFRSLMLTSWLINLEATELFFKNVVVEFNLSHNDDPSFGYCSGLVGFSYRWKSGSAHLPYPNRVEDLNSIILDDYMRKVRSVALIMKSSTLLHRTHFEHLDLEWQANPLHEEDTMPPHDLVFRKNLDFIIRALNAAPLSEKLSVSIQSTKHFVSTRLTNIDAPRTSSLLSRTDRELAVERFSWHLAPFQALLKVHLRIDVESASTIRHRNQRAVKVRDKLIIQHPDLTQYLADLQDTEQRAVGVKDDFIYSKKIQTTFGWPELNYYKDDPVITHR